MFLLEKLVTPTQEGYSRLQLVTRWPFKAMVWIGEGTETFNNPLVTNCLFSFLFEDTSVKSFNLEGHEFYLGTIMNLKIDSFLVKQWAKK